MDDGKKEQGGGKKKQPHGRNVLHWLRGRDLFAHDNRALRAASLKAREAYMHNRLQTDVASYLRTNLLIDYLWGERYFAEHPVGWGLCNVTQGWGPSYTVFSPVTQAGEVRPKGRYPSSAFVA
ncbi:hypothetical protein DL771_000164 [Monosporascus sp. 5C6A]|nr:hypothetical protein DL771_000164 [Monosporascus sp. 5C6A]